jgi:hypothetical protein
MATVIQILTTNYSGETAHITFTPCSGGTIDLGNQVLPYNYESENYLGSYSLYFSAFTRTCTFEIPCPTSTPTPTPLSPTATPTQLPATATPTPTTTITSTQTPTPAPTSTQTPTPTVDCQCPSGYESSDDGSICYKITVSSPTVNDTLQPEAGADNNNYGQFGVKIYNINDYNISGNSISGNLAFSGFTVVADGSPTTNTELFYSTRMNANNVWVAGNANWPDPDYPDYISFCSTFVLTESKTYYVGIAGDNDVTIKLNGTTIVDQVDTEPDTNFKYWHVYPVVLNSGPNIIELENWNRSEVGSFAAEIYDNTLSQMINATGTTMLNIVFATGDYLPGGSKAGQGFCSNYTCPSGYTLDTTDPQNPICKLIETTSCINGTPTPTPVPPTATPTQLPATATPTPTTTITPTDTPTPEPETPTPTPTPTIDICIDCPTGYTWTAIDGSSCVALETVSATAPQYPLTAYTRTYYEYSMSGTTIFEPGWNVNGTGTVNTVLNTPSLWKNTSTTNGPLNRTGLWVDLDTADPVDYPLNVWVGFNFCVTGFTGGTYYIGLGADNEYRLEIDGNVILDTSSVTGTPESLDKFRKWHVYPVTLTGGQHIIGLYGYNQTNPGINPAGFGCEIYNNTLSELVNANNINDLNIIFSSTEFIGEIIQVVKDGNGQYLTSGYTCPTGYEYAPCDGTCWKNIYCPELPTPTPTATPTVTPTPTPTITVDPPTDTPTPVPTSTPTPTPTITVDPPTPTPTFDGYYYYSVRQYNCSDSCNVLSPDLAGRSSEPLSTTDGAYYKLFGQPNVYQVQTEITPAPESYDLDFDTFESSHTDCTMACGITAPTPTVTPAPTDAPTPTPTETPLPPGTPTPTPVFTAFNGKQFTGDTSFVCACESIGTDTTFYINDTNLNTFTSKLYFDEELTQVVPNGSLYKLVSTDEFNTTVIATVDNVGNVTFIFDCTTPINFYNGLRYPSTGTTSYYDICQSIGTNESFHIDLGGPLQVGQYLWSSQYCTAASSDYVYKLITTTGGTESTYIVTVGDSIGTISSITECSSINAPTPTPTATLHPTVTPEPATETPTPTPLPPDTLPPTDTPTPTPTADPFFYYDAEQYDCGLDGNCVYEGDVTLRNVTEITLLNRFRNDSVSGKKFKVTNSISPGSFDYETAMTGAGTSTCSDLCPQPATPTPTPTATSTVTPLPATDTPTPTPLPATATPTPTVTPLPATATPTVTPLPATAVPTETPTPTPTPQPVINVKFFTSRPSGYLDCNGGTEISVSLNNTTFCNTSIYTSSYFTSLPTTNYWLAYDGDYKEVFHTSGQNTVSQGGSCQACNLIAPTATPTTTPTATPTPLPATATPTPTGAPTNTPTPSPTPLPATSTPTPSPLPATAVPTETPTPTPTPQPQITVNIHTLQPSGYLDCNGGTPIAVQLNGTTFCNTSTYTSSYFTGLGQSTFWLSYDGNYRQIFHFSGQNTANQSGGCQACNSTPATATPLPATATPEPATPTPLPATATPEPATPEPTATPLPATATPEPATATPVPPTSYTYQLGPSYTTATQACENFGMDFYIEAFAAEDQPFNVTQFFTDTNLTIPYVGESETHAFARISSGSLISLTYTGRISSSGFVSDRTVCP